MGVPYSVNKWVSYIRYIRMLYSNDSKHYAKKVIQDIREQTDVLDDLPKLGKKVPELNDDAVRELSLYSYRIIYEIMSQGIFVLAVVHKRRGLKAGDIQRS